MRYSLQICYKIKRSYPKGNFGGNQLPGGSMGLSPLYSGLAGTICTSVPHNAGFHQSFRLASPCLSIDHHLSGLNRCTLRSLLNHLNNRERERRERERVL